MDFFETLNKLTASNGVSGNEENVFDCISEILNDFECKRTLSGLSVQLGERRNGVPHFILDAHIDQIGFRVTSITDDGFITCDKCGGIDKRILPAQKVIIHGKKDITGVFCSTPPHLSSAGTSVSEVPNMYIDTGMCRQSLENIISLGDSISFEAPMRKLCGTKVSSGALDNRAGCLAVIYALDILKNKQLPCSITTVFSVQEELGERGAKMAGFAENADYAITVDVSFAFSLGEKKEKCGTMGSGPMIGFSPVLDKNLSLLAAKIAQNNAIPFQCEIMSGNTSTNADTYGISCGGAKTALLSVPIRYMHTPTEVCDIEDIKSTGLLLALLVESICSSDKNI